MRSAVEHLLITAHAHAHPLIKPILIGIIPDICRYVFFMNLFTIKEFQRNKSSRNIY